MKFFRLHNPGWADDMVLKSVKEVLTNIEVEIKEQWEDSLMLLDPNTFIISVIELTPEEYEALEEWDG